MENPRVLLRRAKRNRGAKKTAMPALGTDERASAPMHVSHHSNYTALMRSHDRVRTRHIGVKG